MDASPGEARGGVLPDARRPFRALGSRRGGFDRELVDADWAINNGNWMWLSCSCFFYQYFRVYGPVSFGKKYDKNGDFIRHYLPQLRNMPAKYIYEPWLAPPDVQKKAGCVVGVDYPEPIVDHAVASKECIDKIAEAYKVHKEGGRRQRRWKETQSGRIMTRSSRVDYDFIDPLPRATPGARAPVSNPVPFLQLERKVHLAEVLKAVTAQRLNLRLCL